MAASRKPGLVAVIGGGVIGGGWVARFALNGVDVNVFDPDPEAERKIGEVMENAGRALQQLTMAPLPGHGAITYCKSAAEAASGGGSGGGASGDGGSGGGASGGGASGDGASGSGTPAPALIIEAVPERLDVKQKVYAQIEEGAAPDAIIASSTSGILPSDLQAKMTRPQRLLVAHPFNPVYLLPLVELVGGKKTEAKFIKRAGDMLSGLGMHPLPIDKEIEAFVADRFLEAVWREALWLVKDGIATTSQIDDAIRYGFGLRWAQMGLFETYRIAGGEAGMAHFLEQFGPCLKWPWTKLMDVPELTDDLVRKVSSQSDAQSGMHSIRELERIRDDNLVGIMQALKVKGWGAGKALADWEAQLYDAAPAIMGAGTGAGAGVGGGAGDGAGGATGDGAGGGAGDGAGGDANAGGLLETFRRQVPAGWTDYNGHMNEARYLDCFSLATDAVMRWLGVDDDYVKAGGSYFTVETHIRHLDEVLAGVEIFTTTQLLRGEGKKMHLFHNLYAGDGKAPRLIATGEHMLIHVDMKKRSSSLPTKKVAEKLDALAAAHERLPAPEGAGRAVGV